MRSAQPRSPLLSNASPSAESGVTLVRRDLLRPAKSLRMAGEASTRSPCAQHSYRHTERRSAAAALALGFSGGLDAEEAPAATSAPHSSGRTAAGCLYGCDAR